MLQNIFINIIVFKIEIISNFSQLVGKKSLTNVRSLKVKMKHVKKLNKWAPWSTYLSLLTLLLLLNVPSFRGGALVQISFFPCVSISANSIRCRYLISFSHFHTKCGSPSVSRTGTQTSPFEACYFYAWYCTVTAPGPMVLIIRQRDFSPSQHQRMEEELNHLPSSFQYNNNIRKFWLDFSKQSDVIVLQTPTPNSSPQETVNKWAIEVKIHTTAW